MNLIDVLNWRYAAKRMTGDIIPKSDLNQILEAIRLAPSSYGLQPFSVTMVESRDKLNEIYEKASPQPVLKQCSHLLIFKARTRIDSELVESYLEDMAKARNATEEQVENTRKRIGSIQNNPSFNRLSWSMRQAYIALGYGTFAAAQLGIDSTPMEGFDVDALNNLLVLDVEKERAAVMLALGYRSEDEDHSIKYAKVRRSPEKMFEII